MNKRLLQLVLLATILAVIVPSVVSQSIIDKSLSRIGVSKDKFNVANIYDKYQPFLDFVAYAILFIGIATFALGQHFRGTATVPVMVGIILAIATAVFASKMKPPFMLADLGPFALIIGLGLIAFMIYSMFRGMGMNWPHAAAWGLFLAGAALLPIAERALASVPADSLLHVMADWMYVILFVAAVGLIIQLFQLVFGLWGGGAQPAGAAPAPGAAPPAGPAGPRAGAAAAAGGGPPPPPGGPGAGAAGAGGGAPYAAPNQLPHVFEPARQRLQSALTAMNAHYEHVRNLLNTLPAPAMGAARVAATNGARAVLGGPINAADTAITTELNALTNPALLNAAFVDPGRRARVATALGNIMASYAAVQAMRTHAVTTLGPAGSPINTANEASAMGYAASARDNVWSATVQTEMGTIVTQVHAAMVGP
ncbi:hypothetical protein HY640_02665 [Candidatus Woesearchaeota archaeon]|nr:hypothetical protein [Candidatus Woesearchaeota archaeon]